MASIAQSKNSRSRNSLLQPYILNNELVFLPTCYRCGKPIRKFSEANLIVRGIDDDFSTPADDGLERLHGEVCAVCWDCDDGDEIFVPLRYVLKANQRGHRSRVFPTSKTSGNKKVWGNETAETANRK